MAAVLAVSMACSTAGDEGATAIALENSISRTATAHREEFSKTDVLLADALTELLNLKEQVNSLQARVDTLTSGQTRPATSPARRPVRRRISSDVK